MEEALSSVQCQICPPVRASQGRVVLGHGGGGRLFQSLLNDCIQPAFGAALQHESDSAVVDFQGQPMALTTDTYVVRPRFFPGGDIGTLAVVGTANDLAMVGAKPVFLSCALVIEEGFDLAELQEILHRIQQAAVLVGAPVVTGDTKVVEKGSGDGLFINTTGVGLPLTKQTLHPRGILPGQQVIVTGDLGRHGACVMAARDGIIAPALTTDCAYLGSMTGPLLLENSGCYCLRDITRGGLAATLNECAISADVSILLSEASIPISEPVQSLCDLMGYDPLHLANEGRCVMFCEAEHTPAILQSLQSQALGAGACVIGQVVAKGLVPVAVRTVYGTERVLAAPSGELLSRIC